MEKKVMYAIIGIVIIAVSAIAAYYVLQTPTSAVVEIEYWDNFKGELASAQALDKVIADFEAVYPNIKVTVTHYDYDPYFEKLSTSMAAGTPPEIFVTDAGGSSKALVDEGQLSDLTSLMNEAWAVELFPAGTRLGFTFGDKIYAIPYELNIQCIIVNKGVFEQVGVQVPSENESWTWNQFLNVIQTFKAAGVQPLTIRAADPRQMADYLDWLIFRVVGNDRAIKTYNREAGYHFTDEPFVQAYQYFADLVATNPFPEGWQTAGQTEAILTLEQGNAAIDLWYSFSVEDMRRDVPTIKLDTVRDPSFPNYNLSDADMITDGGNGLAIAEHSAHKEEAKTFLRYMFEKNRLTAFATASGTVMSANISLPPGTLNDINEKLVRMLQSSDQIGIRWVSFAHPEFGTTYQTLNQEVLFGLKTPQQACQELEAKAEELHSQGKIP